MPVRFRSDSELYSLPQELWDINVASVFFFFFFHRCYCSLLVLEEQEGINVWGKYNL